MTRTLVSQTQWF